MDLSAQFSQYTVHIWLIYEKHFSLTWCKKVVSVVLDVTVNSMMQDLKSKRSLKNVNHWHRD